MHHFLFSLFKKMTDEKVESSNESSDKIREMFDALMITLEAYLSAALCKVNEALLIDPIPQTVMIFADDFLLQFPLEYLNVFKKPEIQTLGRDFSLQMFYHRLKRGETGMILILTIF